MKAHTKAMVSVQGRYKLVRRKAVTLPDGTVEAGDIVEETPWCKNILTLYYFNQAMTTANLQPSGCVVGTGNSTPLETNTTLDAFVAGTGTTQNVTTNNNWTVSPRYAQVLITYRFAQGDAAGNIAEVGVVIPSTGITSATPVLSRALVVDGGGSPTVVTVLSDEFLDVFWECTWFVPEDVAGSFNMTIDGTPEAFNYTVRAIGLGDGEHWNFGSARRIGAYYPVFAALSGNFGISRDSAAATTTTLTAYDANPNLSSSNRVINVTSASYVSDSKERTHTLYWGLSEANIAIRSIYVRLGGSYTGGNNLGAFQVLLDHAVTKTSSKLFQFSLTLSMDNVP